MNARYGNERSSLSVPHTLFVFPIRHAANTAKRIFYNFFLRNFGLASIHLVLGTVLLLFGVSFGAYQWIRGSQTLEFASSGTVMLAALPVIVGVQFLLNFIAFDMAHIPREPIHQRLANSGPRGRQAG